MKTTVTIAVLLATTFFGLNASAKDKAASDKENTYDVVIYNATSAGVLAAVEASKLGKSVVLIEPTHRIGGMTSCGLTFSDFGNTKAIGGLALDFFKRVGAKSGKSEPIWYFEPKVALAVFQDYVDENHIPVVYGERLDLKHGVVKDGTRIVSIKMESGKVFKGKQFIDAGYEGDLMAKAGVSYTVGRESNGTYGEIWNGIQPGNQLPPGIDPYKVPGDPKSGLISRVNANAGGPDGAGDKKVMALNYRITLCRNPENRIMIEKPAGYNEADYEILFRAIGCGQHANFFKTDSGLLLNDKADANNDSGISTDYIGVGSSEYPEANYATREKIRKEVETYQRGFVWTVQNHPRVPQAIRNAYKGWGLAKDEYTDNNNWPPQIYVREARRMISDYVLTEHDVLLERVSKQSIGLGCYPMDSHHMQYCIGWDGFVRTEGGRYIRFETPYPIDYRAIVPKASQCTNLTVPICISISHSANGSFRCEPVYMIVGQSAAVASCLAIDKGVSVQDVPYKELSERLVADNQIIQWSKGFTRTSSVNYTIQTPAAGDKLTPVK
jgi:hypothetical protein